MAWIYSPPTRGLVSYHLHDLPNGFEVFMPLFVKSNVFVRALMISNFFPLNIVFIYFASSVGFLSLFEKLICKSFSDINFLLLYVTNIFPIKLVYCLLTLLEVVFFCV